TVGICCRAPRTAIAHSVLRYDTRSLSCCEVKLEVTPCRSPLFDISRASSVGALPSCRYGALRARPRSEGTLKPPLRLLSGSTPPVSVVPTSRLNVALSHWPMWQVPQPALKNTCAPRC